MNIKWNEKYRAGAVCLFAALAMIIGGWFASHRDSSARMIGRVPDPRDAAGEFFEVYRRGDYEALDNYIYGYESIGLSGSAESNYGQRMLEYISSEFVYEFKSEPVIEGNTATVTADVKYFYIPDTVDELKQIVNEEVLSSMKEDSEGIDLSVHNEEYYNGIVLPSLDKAVDRMMEQHKDQYMRSCKLELEMVYVGAGWKIVPTDSLEEVLLGGMS